MLYILDILEDTTVDGPGFRTSVYCAGCPNRCPGCHNPQSWDMSNGSAKSTAEILEVILADPLPMSLSVVATQWPRRKASPSLPLP